MRFVAGIDGGQSSTTALIVDENGLVRGRGMAGPADHIGEPPGSTKLAQACASALAAACDAGGLPRATHYAAVVAGVSGYDDGFDGAWPRLPTDRVRVLHDAPIALAGAVTMRPAVCVIGGTGSVAYGEDGLGRALTVGGWGYLFGDAGSAFAVARDALAAAMRADDLGEQTPLGAAARDFFEERDLRALATAALAGRISRAALASFARLVHDAARLGDLEAGAIVAAAADALAALGAIAATRLDSSERIVRIAFTGGSFADRSFFERTRERLHEHAPQALAVEPRYDPVTGAALLAFVDAGLAVPDRIAE